MYAVVGLVAVIILNRLVTPRLPYYSAAHVSSIRALVDQATAWHGFAASRESNLSGSHRLVYASRAVSYLSAARSTMPDAAIERATGVDVADFVIALETSEVTYMRMVDGSHAPVVAWLKL